MSLEHPPHTGTILRHVAKIALFFHPRKPLRHFFTLTSHPSADPRNASACKSHPYGQEKAKKAVPCGSKDDALSATKRFCQLQQRFSTSQSIFMANTPHFSPPFPWLAINFSSAIRKKIVPLQSAVCWFIPTHSANNALINKILVL